jgi:hypothetical protein
MSDFRAVILFAPTAVCWQKLPNEAAQQMCASILY